MSEVQYEVRPGAHVAVVTIDRPEARNAISPEVARGIEDAVDRSEEDDDVRVVVLTGTPPVFCAGADLKAVGAGRGAELFTERGGFGGLTRRERTVPWIAAVDGPALAGGTAADDETAWALSEQSQALVEASDDVQEGVRAFVEKRAPVWTGR